MLDGRGAGYQEERCDQSDRMRRRREPVYGLASLGAYLKYPCMLTGRMDSGQDGFAEKRGPLELAGIRPGRFTACVQSLDAITAPE
jgi:hypothetical protein